MAYTNSNNEVTEVLTDIHKNNRGDIIRVSKITKDSSESFDLRNMYTDDNDEIRYTSKGIRFKNEFAVDIVTSIIKELGTDDLNKIVDVVNECADKINSQSE